jgi:hypothetical protein
MIETVKNLLLGFLLACVLWLSLEVNHLKTQASEKYVPQVDQCEDNTLEQFFDMIQRLKEMESENEHKWN